MSNYWKNAEEINTEFENLKNLIKKDILWFKSLRDPKESKDSKLTPDELAALKFKIKSNYYPLLSNEAKFYYSASKLKLSTEDLQIIGSRIALFKKST